MEDASRQQEPTTQAEDSRERARIERVYNAYSSDPYYKTIWSGEAARFLLERKWEEIVRLLREEEQKERALDERIREGSEPR